MAPPWKLNLSPLSNSKIVTHQNSNGKMKYQKVVDFNDVLGYVVMPGGSAGAPFIRPIYRAILMASPAGGIDKGTQYIFSCSHVGDRLNGFDYSEDSYGCTLANIAAQAIQSLESMNFRRKEVDVRPKKIIKVKKKRRK